MDRRGAALLIVTVIIVLIIILIASLMPRVVNQRQVAQRSADSIRALYAAESGINRAVQDLNTRNNIYSIEIDTRQRIDRASECYLSEVEDLFDARTRVRMRR